MTKEEKESLDRFVRGAVESIEIILNNNDHREEFSCTFTGDVGPRTSIVLFVSSKPKPPLDRIVDAL